MGTALRWGCWTATFLGFLAWAGVGAARAADVLTLATTTSTENSGLLAFLHPGFEQQTGIRIKVVAKGTGAALRLARDGNVDVVLTHDPDQEKTFIDDGFGVLVRNVMFNDFVLLGPAADPANVREAKTADEAMRRIARLESGFVSRGDASGTHGKEQQLWKSCGVAVQTQQASLVVDGKKQWQRTIVPSGSWYFSIGQGMSRTILVATEKRAYTLSDRGTYYSMALTEPAKTDLAIVFQRDRRLTNPYRVMAVNSARHPHVHRDAAEKYIAWLTSKQTQAKIAEFQIGGKQLFFPSADAESPK